MPTIFELSALAAALGSGLVAGVCFAFAAFVLRALDRLGPAPAIRAMQAINATILRSGAMGVWFGTAAIGLLAAALAEEPGLTAASAVLYGIGAVVITGGANVPLNGELARVDPGAPGAAEAWRAYLDSWGRWNALRTALFALASVGFASALLPL